MNCLECHEWLHERLDGHPVSEQIEQQIELHIAQCTACREQHAAGQLLLDGLKEMPRPAMPPGFAQVLAGTVIRDRRQRREKLRRRVFVTMALAASVMLMLFAAYYWIPHTPPLQ